ncbi:hypothetical protein SJAG_04967 [Schizosaccharomyces japonicus yFS275]|uniref:Uncharacterized protein n=1 Tax=Schizosaccharomyces japonicus (strain yFS275 / FY16936) TaxID=402676 RepID=B6K887_SCHJY|nr:hypothetical protein SJAG_04967 [Schizosaccharomyces japonicus yFS275]EEB09741.1 hypothetical protein SJAG_04967 [Schizosaccharomyces japonicus yFS275]
MLSINSDCVFKNVHSSIRLIRGVTQAKHDAVSLISFFIYNISHVLSYNHHKLFSQDIVYKRYFSTRSGPYVYRTEKYVSLQLSRNFEKLAKLLCSVQNDLLSLAQHYHDAKSVEQKYYFRREYVLKRKALTTIRHLRAPLLLTLQDMNILSCKCPKALLSLGELDRMLQSEDVGSWLSNLSGALKTNFLPNSVSHYNFLLARFLSRRFYFAVDIVWQAMRLAEVPVNDETVSLVTELYVNQQRWDALMIFFKHNYPQLTEPYASQFYASVLKVAIRNDNKCLISILYAVAHRRHYFDFRICELFLYDCIKHKYWQRGLIVYKYMLDACKSNDSISCRLRLAQIYWKLCSRCKKNALLTNKLSISMGSKPLSKTSVPYNLRRTADVLKVLDEFMYSKT